MPKKHRKIDRKFNFPLMIVLLFIVLPSTLVLITELSTDQMLYRMIMQSQPEAAE